MPADTPISPAPTSQQLEELRTMIVQALPSIADRSIRFADVAVVIRDHTSHAFLEKATPEMQKLVGYDRSGLSIADLLLIAWNIYRDDLDRQPPETVALLHFLICKP
jgi:hypothetical protein